MTNTPPPKKKPFVPQDWVESRMSWLPEFTLQFVTYSRTHHFLRWCRHLAFVSIIIVTFLIATWLIIDFNLLTEWVPEGERKEFNRHNQFVHLIGTLSYGSILLIGVAAVVGLYIKSRDEYRAESQKAELDRLRSIERAARSGQIATLGELYDLNQNRIDYYHTIATRQSRASFRSGQLAAYVGFAVVLALGAFAAFSPKGNAASIAASVTAAAAAALSGFVSSTFMKSQSFASDQLKQFFSQPVEQSRALTAERLASELEGSEKTSATRDIIRGLVSALASDIKGEERSPKLPDDERSEA